MYRRRPLDVASVAVTPAGRVTLTRAGIAETLPTRTLTVLALAIRSSELSPGGAVPRATTRSIDDPAAATELGRADDSARARAGGDDLRATGAAAEARGCERGACRLDAQAERASAPRAATGVGAPLMLPAAS